VYALGRPGLGPYGEAWAAALAAGDRGALTGWSAAALMSLAEWPRRPELLVVGGSLRLHGARVLRTRSLAPDEIIEDAAGLRFTAWPRTVTDLAARSSVAELQTVLDALDRRGLLHLPTLHAAIRRACGREGLPKLRRALEPFTTLPDADYRSLLERFGAMLLRSRALAEHEVNGPVDLPSGRRIHVDVLFRDAMVAVEIDGRDSHDRAVQFGIDRERDRELQKLGYRVLRFTWEDVMPNPRRVIRDIRALLGS
jgi:very-short-patch-repair endonuclease